MKNITVLYLTILNLFALCTYAQKGKIASDIVRSNRVAQILNIDVANIPTQPSLAYDQIIEGVLSNKIKALWIVATNPAHSWINQHHLIDALSRLECLVVQDMYSDTETTQLADIVLPAAGWGEKEGTFINSERRIGVIKRVARAPGEALADFHIFRLVAEAWGCAEMFAEWSSPEAVFEILKRLSAGQPCDITGIGDYARIDRVGGIQWPFAAGSELESNQRRLFADGRYFTADQKAKFLFQEPRPLPEAPSKAYPLLLLTGRGTDPPSQRMHIGSREYIRHNSPYRFKNPREKPEWQRQ